MLSRCVLALALLLPFANAQSLRTEADAQALEARAESNPDDVNLHNQLIVFYFRMRPPSMSAESVRTLRRKHIVWMIEHHPEHVVLSDLATTIDRAADPEGFAEADAAWKRVLEHALNAEVYAHAISFYRTADAPFALALADKGLAAYPHSSSIAGAKGIVLVYLMLGIRHVDQYGRATSFDTDLISSKEGVAARKELESTTEAALAGGAATPSLAPGIACSQPTPHSIPSAAAP